MPKRTKEQYAMVRRIHAARAELAYQLEVFGDEIADREDYRGLVGMDAIRLYLMNKHHWLPEQMRSMQPEDYRLLLTEEMRGWEMPETAL